MTTTRLTPLINAAVRVNTSGEIAVAVALGDGGTAWVRLADGQQKQYPIDDLTVITPGVSRPNRPARVVLTPAAKRALRDATMHVGGYWYLGQVPVATTEERDAYALELVRLHLADDMGSELPHTLRYAVTENGLRMRTYLLHQTHLGHLAKQVRAEDIDGEDLADLAAGIDAGEDAGSITGTSIDFQLAFALAVTLSEQSAEDLRQDLETYLGWRD